MNTVKYLDSSGKEIRVKAWQGSNSWRGKRRRSVAEMDKFMAGLGIVRGRAPKAVAA